MIRQIYSGRFVGITGSMLSLMLLPVMFLPGVIYAGEVVVLSRAVAVNNPAMIQIAAVSDTSKTTGSFVSKDRDSDPEGFDRATSNASTPEPPVTPAEPDIQNTSDQSELVTEPASSDKDSLKNETIDAQLPAAVIWYKESAQKGDKDAQYNLGAVYETGFGVTLDFKEASKWYLMAAEQDHILAQLHLGILYMLGKGVKESSIKGSKWIRAAAKNGNELAKMLNEKVLSNEGEFKMDEKKVIAEVHAALENGDIYAQEKLIHVLAKLKKKQQNQPKKERFAGTVTGSGAKPGTVENEVPAFLDDNSRKQSISEGDLISIRRHANEGEAESQYLLGRMYETGKQVEKDKTHAVNWYKSAASQGHRDAQYRLALALIYGVGVDKNINQGAEWLQKAASQKHETANRIMHYFTSPDTGAVNYNCSLAFAWNLERALNGDGDAQLSVGYMLENGWGVYQNVTEARQWLVKASASGAKGASGQLRQMKVSQFEGELPTSTPSVRSDTSRVAASPSTSEQVKVPVSEPRENTKEKGFFDFDFDFSFSMPTAGKMKSLMVPVGLILIGLTLGMIVFRWMDRMMSNGQQAPTQNKEESLFR